MTTYIVDATDLANCLTQVGYVQSALDTVEAHNPIRAIDVGYLHKQLNALSIIAARSIKDGNGTPLDDSYFGGSGGSGISGTTPQSGGTNKGP